MTLISRSCFFAIGLLLCACVGVGQASHIFSRNITINGIAVASGNSFVDPLITVDVGENITFSFDLFGPSDTFNVSFIKDGGTLLAPANTSFAYNGSGTSAAPVNFSYTVSYSTAGTFDGRFVPDHLDSFPDYKFPGGSEGSEPVIPFQLQVNDAAVPEPTTLGIWSMVALGSGVVGWNRRRRKAA